MEEVINGILIREVETKNYFCRNFKCGINLNKDTVMNPKTVIKGKIRIQIDEILDKSELFDATEVK